MIALQNAFNARNKKLNKIEKLKELRTPKEAFLKLTYYAKNGFDSILEEDKNFFLKCFGIYYREKTPRQFMLKLRIPAGHLNSSQANTIGQCAKEFGNDYLDLTTRTQCELRYLDIENLPTILNRLKEVGIDSYQTGVDNIRGIMGDPFDTLAYDNTIPSYKTILKLQELFLYDYKWIGTLPRKFNIAITGNMVNRCNVFVHDCCFVLANKDGIYGYNMYLGGKVGHIAKSADIFLKDENEVLKAFESIASIFKEYGFRDNRNKNRLSFLIDAVGMQEISNAIRKIANVDFATAGITLTNIDYFEPDNGKLQLNDGTFAIHSVIPSGIFTGTALIQVANLAKKYGNEQIRFDMEQSLYILGVKEPDAILNEPYFNKYKNIDSPYKNHLIACAGTEHCPFGVIENKNDAIELSNYLESKVPLENARVRMYWSACVKGCGIHGLGDIGFEGCKAKINNQNVSGVHISLGGKLISEGNEGYTIIRNAPLKYSKYYIESLMLQYVKLRNQNESFESFHDRILLKYTPAYIGFLLKLLAYLRKKNINIDFGFIKNPTTGKNEEFEIFDMGNKLYYTLSKQKAYTTINKFTNTFKNEKPQNLRKLLTNYDENLVLLIEDILHPKEEKRAIVFSQIDKYIAL